MHNNDIDQVAYGNMHSVLVLKLNIFKSQQTQNGVCTYMRTAVYYFRIMHAGNKKKLCS